MKQFCRALVTVAALALLPSLASAQGYISSDRFGYRGTVTRYADLADLLGRVNGTTYNSPARDLAVYFVDNNSAFTGSYPPTEAWFLSAWFLNGGNTPSNQDAGFIQLGDGDGGTLSSLSLSWTDAARTQFSLSATGGNSIYGCGGDPQDCGRLWNGSTASGGVFYSYMISLVAGGLTPATFNSTTGVWESVGQPTYASGSMKGIFQNTSTTDTANNGWYEYDMTIDMNSYANDAGYLANDPSYFGSNVTATPEPATVVLMASGLLGVFTVARRRRKNA